MDGLIQIGVQWIIAIQGWGTWLEMPMKFFSFIGSENFFLLILPLIYWCIDARLGLRLGFILISSVYTRGFLKFLFAGPRPYWVSDRIIAYAAEPTFGVPSGHAQIAVDVWGILAAAIRKKWAWVVAVGLIFFIGVSRLYLGVHFPHDVVVGWLLGAALLWIFLRFEGRVAAWLAQKTLRTQILIGFIISLGMIALAMLVVASLGNYVFPDAYKANALRASDQLPDPVSMDESISSAGIFFGLVVGAAWIKSRGGYQVEGPLEQRVRRFVVGLIGVILFWQGLGLVLPRNADLISSLFRYFRYALVGFWLFGGAPWLFFRFKLAKSNM